jgi:nickel/cobalt transporter (NiCoT) family protein
MNLVILGGIIKIFQAMRRGEYDEAELERQLGNRGFFYRFFGRWMKAIDKEWQMYPVGVVFGMGFDAATEVVLQPPPPRSWPPSTSPGGPSSRYRSCSLPE